MGVSRCLAIEAVARGREQNVAVGDDLEDRGTDQLVATEGRARTLTLDLLAQWRGLEANGQFRFTPPTHALLAFRQASTDSLRRIALENVPAGRTFRLLSGPDGAAIGTAYGEAFRQHRGHPYPHDNILEELLKSA